MSTNRQDLIHAYLDGELTQEEEVELNAWVKAAPQNARALVALAKLHDRLSNVVRAGRVMEAVPSESRNVGVPEIVPVRRHWRPMKWIGGLSAVAAMALFVLWAALTTPLNAATELDRLLETTLSLPDRTYRIKNLDSEPERPQDRRPPVNGATLHLRNPDQYVLIRLFPDGRKLITGSDGERSYAIPPDGVVHLSADSMRFRGALPGAEQGIPFVDLRSDLLRLRDAYVISVLKPQANGWRGLRCEKKSAQYRGPRIVELWYDPQTLMIHRIVLDKMPKARGGPTSVAFELVEQRELGTEFFKHQTHHEPQRPLHEED